MNKGCAAAKLEAGANRLTRLESKTCRVHVPDEFTFCRARNADACWPASSREEVVEAAASAPRMQLLVATNSRAVSTRAGLRCNPRDARLPPQRAL